MQSQVVQTLKDLQSPSNDTRSNAENQLTQMRQAQAQDLLQGLLALVVAAEAGQDTEKALACVLFKKYYLDDRKEEKECQQITAE